MNLLKQIINKFWRNESNLNNVKVADSEALEGYLNDFLSYVCDKTQLQGKKILEIGCGDGKLLKYIAANYDVALIIGVDPYLDSWWQAEENAGDRFKIVNGNCEKLSFDAAEFDLVISAATFEHVDNVEISLKEIYRVLKEKGEFITGFGPIWSGILGHHWNHGTAEEVVKIPPWGHLYLTYDEMKEHIMKHDSEETAERMCQHIYCSDLINRVDYKTFKQVFESSQFNTIKLEKQRINNRLQWSSGENQDELTKEIYEKLKHRYTKDELEVISLYAYLTK